MSVLWGHQRRANAGGTMQAMNVEEAIGLAIGALHAQNVNWTNELAAVEKTIAAKLEEAVALGANIARGEEAARLLTSLYQRRNRLVGREAVDPADRKRNTATVAHQLRCARIASGMTLAEAGKIRGMSKQSWNHRETGIVAIVAADFRAVRAVPPKGCPEVAPARKKKNARSLDKLINWNDIDWTRTGKAIAAELGVHQSTVSRRKREMEDW